jgi:hypothetical protein
LKILGEVLEGWACAGANEKELTTCEKKGGHEEGKGGGKYTKKKDPRHGQQAIVGRWPALVDQLLVDDQGSPNSGQGPGPAGNQRALASRNRQSDRLWHASSSFCNFLSLFCSSFFFLFF